MSSTPPSPALGRPGRHLLASNALDAAGRQGVDVATDVVAVLAVGASAAQMGLLNAIGSLAFLVLGIPIGVLVDRSPTVRLLAASGLLRALLVGCLVTLMVLDALTMTHLYVLSGLIGVTTVVTETTQTTITPRIGGPDLVTGLVARMQSAESVIGLVVPTVAGAMVAAAGASPVLVVGAALTTLASLVVLRLPLGGRETDTVPAGSPDPDHPDDPGALRDGPVRALTRLWSEAARGWVVLRRNPMLWRLTVASMLVNLGIAAHSAVEVVLVLRTLDLGPAVLGLLFSLGAVGALAGSAVAVPLSTRLGTVRTLRLAASLLAPIAALTLMALIDPARAVWWLAASSLLWGLVMVIYNVVNAGWSAGLTPADVMGRVSATRRTLSMGVIPAGSVIGGLLADQLGMAWAVGVWVLLNTLGAAALITADLQENQGRGG